MSVPSSSPDGVMPAALETAEAARYIGVAPKTLANWRTRGVGPSYVRAGARVVYRLVDLDAWLNVNRVSVGGEG